MRRCVRIVSLQTQCRFTTVPAIGFVEPTMASMREEILDILDHKEQYNPVPTSIATLCASMLGDLELYQEGMVLLCEELGVPALATLDHNRCTDAEMRSCVYSCIETFKAYPAPPEVRLWILSRICVAAGNMYDDTRASAASCIVETLLEEKSNDYSAPEVWAQGYLLYHSGRATRESLIQQRTSPGGVQKVTSRFGLSMWRMEKLVKGVEGEMADVVWAKTMLLSAVGASGAKEHWGRFSWCNEAWRLPVGDYKGWALALCSAAASGLGSKDDAARLADQAMAVVRGTPKEQLAPNDAMLTVLTLRSSFVDLHRLDPLFSKKTAKRICPALPFVQRGLPVGPLGIPRYAIFSFKEGELKTVGMNDGAIEFLAGSRTSI